VFLYVYCLFICFGSNLFVCLCVFKVRVNPSTSQVEIDLSMDVHSKNYDSNFGLNMTKQVVF
jgi:hypothetical protein